MLVTDDKITMSDGEWDQFQTVTHAPWRPRTKDEFNAMCDLGSAFHRVENIENLGVLFAQNCQRIKFSADGAANFPVDRRRLAFIKVHGYAPSPEELAQFLDGNMPGPSASLSLVKS
jgi:hypothetical protein